MGLCATCSSKNVSNSASALRFSLAVALALDKNSSRLSSTRRKIFIISSVFIWGALYLKVYRRDFPTFPYCEYGQRGRPHRTVAWRAQRQRHHLAATVHPHASAGPPYYKSNKVKWPLTTVPISIKKTATKTVGHRR